MKINHYHLLFNINISQMLLVGLINKCQIGNKKTFNSDSKCSLFTD